MQKNKLNIIYEDKEIIVINKPNNLLTIANDKEKLRTLFHEVLVYEKKKYPKNKIFIVHRLDKDTSGVILMAKNEKIKHQLQDKWDEIVLNREYIAIVEGKMKERSGRIESYLAESKTFQTYITNDKRIGKLAITNYEVLKTNKRCSLLKINVLTGRKNQIRVQLQSIGHPIIGDKKYGSKMNSINRMALHAYKLEIVYPATKKRMEFMAKIPKEFENQFGDNNESNS